MGVIRDRWRIWERQQIIDELALTPTDLPSSLATDAEVAALASTNLTDSNLIARHKGVWTINTSWLTGDIVQITSAVANGYPLGLWRCTTTHLGGMTFSGTGAGYWVRLAGDLDSATAAGAFASVINVAGQAGTTADAKFQAAITAAVAQVASGGGAEIVLPPGVSTWTAAVPTLPDLSNYTGKIRIRGSGLGTKIVLTTAAPRFLDFNRTADYQVFGHLEIDHLTIDGGFVNATNHIVVGNMRANAQQARMSFDDIYIHDVEVVNVPTDANVKTRPINLISFHLADNEATATYVRDIRIERFKMRNCGGAGIQVGATTSGVAGQANCTVDNIVFRDCEVSFFATLLNGAQSSDATTLTVNDTSGFPTSGQVQVFSAGVRYAFNYTGKTSTTLTGVTRAAGNAATTLPSNGPVGMPTASCFILGNHGKGGTYTVENVSGGNSGDNFLELDAPTTANVTGVTSTNVRTGSVILANYNLPITASAQVIRLKNISHNDPYTKYGAAGVMVYTTPGGPLGGIYIDGLKWNAAADDGFGGNNPVSVKQVGVSRLDIRNVEATWTLAGPAIGFTCAVVYVETTAAATITLDNITGTITGDCSGGTSPDVSLIDVSGQSSVDLTLDTNRTRFTCTATGIASGKVSHHSVGTRSTSLSRIKGTLRDPRVIDYTNQTSPNGARFGASSTLTLDATHKITVQDADWSAMAASGKEIRHTDTSTPPYVVVAGATKWATGASHDFVYKTAATSRNTTVAPTADPDLQLPVDANAHYVLEGFIVVSGDDQAADFKCSFTLPSGASGTWHPMSPGAAATSAYSSVAELAVALSTTGGSAQIFATITSTKTVVRILALLHTGSTAGTAAFVWSQAVSSATNTTVEADSYLRLTRVA